MPIPIYDQLRSTHETSVIFRASLLECPELGGGRGVPPVHNDRSAELNGQQRASHVRLW